MPSKDGSYEDDAFWAQIQSGTPSLLAFWDHTCAPCKVMAPVFERVGKRFRHRMEFIAVNVYDRPDVGKRFGVTSTPTFIVIRRGKALKRLAGLIPEARLSEYLEPYALPVSVKPEEAQRRGLLARIFRSRRSVSE